ncbi:MAG: arginine deiminase [bacterium]
MANQHIQIDSEIGALKCVLMHEPGPELENITPDSAPEVLYDDILNLPLARAEHKELTSVLAQHAHVMNFTELLADVLENDAVKLNLIKDLCDLYGCPDVVQKLESVEAADLASQLIVGTRMPRNTLERFLSPLPFVLPPLPNAFFTRDATMCVNDRIIIGSMAHRVRVAESLLLKSIFENHQRINNGGFYFDGTESATQNITIEGGDLLIIRHDTIVIGYSERTTAAGIDALVKSMAKAGHLRHAIAVEIPKKRATIHMDMIFTMVDKNACVVFPPLITGTRKCRAFRMDVAEGNVQHVREYAGVLEALSSVGVDLKPINCGGDDTFTQEREQWGSGANFFTFAPGKIIGYHHNTGTIEALNQAGFEIVNAGAYQAADYRDDQRVAVAMNGPELSRGGGGCRCMTMPLCRDDVQW